MEDLFRGEFVRLTAEDPEVLAREEARWQRDSEFHRLANGGTPEMFSSRKIKEWLEKSLAGGFKPESHKFSIRSLADEKLIGFMGLWLDLIHADVWMGIGIGDREDWSKGYGTDAMKLCLRFAFRELGAHRISLALYEYNSRALRVYEKAGFRMEGRTRQDVSKEGQRYDSLWMSILREEWLQMQGVEKR